MRDARYVYARMPARAHATSVPPTPCRCYVARRVALSYALPPRRATQPAAHASFIANADATTPRCSLLSSLSLLRRRAMLRTKMSPDSQPLFTPEEPTFLLTISAITNQREGEIEQAPACASLRRCRRKAKARQNHRQGDKPPSATPPWYAGKSCGVNATERNVPPSSPSRRRHLPPAPPVHIARRCATLHGVPRVRRTVSMLVPADDSSAPYAECALWCRR